MSDAENKEPKKRGRPKGSKDSYKRPPRGSLSNSQHELMGTQTPKEMSSYIEMTRTHLEMEKPKKYTPEIIKERMEIYLNQCQQYGITPTIAGLCSVLQVTRQCFLMWVNGEKNKDCQEICRQYKTMLEEILEIKMLHGKVNPVSGIFMLKNWFPDAYSDRKEYLLTPNTNPLGQPTDEDFEESLKEKYLASIPDE